MALGALGAVATAEASAAPELGRCQRVAGVQEGKKLVHHGDYKNKGCTHLSSTKKGKYEFTAGPGTANKFYEFERGDAKAFVTASGRKLSCSDAEVKGEYTGATTEKITTYKLFDCENEFGKVCQTVATKLGEVEDAGTIEGELGLIKRAGKKTSVGWDQKGMRLVFSCGRVPEVPEEMIIEGSVIGTIAKGSDSNLDRMNTNSIVLFAASEGHQSPEAFEGGEATTLTTRTVTGGAESPEPTGLKGKQEQLSGTGEAEEPETDKEALEIKAIP